jgi:OFA family oxalate/formate antiporter-like MFS transporter
MVEEGNPQPKKKNYNRDATKMTLLVVFYLGLLLCSVTFTCDGFSTLSMQTARKSLFLRQGRQLQQSPLSAKKLVLGMSTVTSTEEKSVDSSLKFPKNMDHCRLIGPACIIGGALTHLTLGTLYCWGNFISYSPLNLRFFDGQFRPGVPADSLYVPSLTLLAQTAVMPFAPVLFQKIGARNMLLIGSWLTAASVYLASFQTSLSTFMLAYSILFGIGLGCAYTAPMYACWKWLPRKKGFVSGGVLAGFGAGGFIFSMVGSKLANPKGLPMVNGLFPPEVYQNFPGMLRSLALLYAILSLIGSIFVLEPAGPFKRISFFAGTSDCPVEYNTTDSKGVTIWQALSTWQFWLMWVMIISSATAGLNTAVIYKQFADSSPILSGDQYQALVGGIGAIFNGAGRIFWGNVADKIGFKTAFTTLTLFQMVMMFTYNFSASSKVPLFFHFYLFSLICVCPIDLICLEYFSFIFLSSG